MASLASLRLHTNAVVATLETAVAATIAVVGDAYKPGVTGWQGEPGHSQFAPYMIVYPLGGGFDGTIGDPDDDASLQWQVTCVGETREQAEWVTDLAIAALVGQPLAIAGRYVPRVELDDAAGGVRPDDSVQPPVFIATPRFTAWSTPA
jgi:hypothetical protein